MRFTATAADVRPGDVVTYCGATFPARTVNRDPVSGLLRIDTGRTPQYVADFREVRIRRADPAETKPYVAYTRLYKPNGDCEKRIHRFATRKALDSFMDRTVRAVTFHN